MPAAAPARLALKRDELSGGPPLDIAGTGAPDSRARSQVTVPAVAESEFSAPTQTMAKKPQSPKLGDKPGAVERYEIGVKPKAVTDQERLAALKQAVGDEPEHFDKG